MVVQGSVGVVVGCGSVGDCNLGVVVGWYGSAG